MGRCTGRAQRLQSRARARRGNPKSQEILEEIRRILAPHVRRMQLQRRVMTPRVETPSRRLAVIPGNSITLTAQSVKCLARSTQAGERRRKFINARELDEQFAHRANRLTGSFILLSCLSNAVTYQREVTAREINTQRPL